MKSKKREINLLPMEYIQAEKLKKYRVMGIVLLVLECLLFVFMVVRPTFNHKQYEEQVLGELERMLAHTKFQAVNQTLEELNEAERELGLWGEQYALFKKRDWINTALLDSLTARMPAGVTINSLQISDGDLKVEISGLTRSSEQLLNYIVILENTFKSAKIEFDILEGTSDASERDYLTYHITVILPIQETPSQVEGPRQAEEIFDVMPSSIETGGDSQ